MVMVLQTNRNYILFHYFFFILFSLFWTCFVRFIHMLSRAPVENGDFHKKENNAQCFTDTVARERTPLVHRS